MQEQEHFRNEGINPLFVITTAGIAVLFVGVVAGAVLMGGLPDAAAGNRDVLSGTDVAAGAPSEPDGVGDTSPEEETAPMIGVEKVGGRESEGDNEGDNEGDGEGDGGSEVAGASPFGDPEPGAVGPGDRSEEETKRPGKSAPEDFSAADWKKEIEEEWSALLTQFEEEGITVDLEKKRVSVKGAIIRDRESRRYPIEYVVVSEGGNTHEALILVKATPSILNAALLALGLEPGTTVIFRKKDPPPAIEDVESGKESEYEVVPPAGTVVRVYVHYEEWTEKPYRPLEDLILNLRTRESLSRVGWVYVGSRFAKVLLGRERVNQYMADLERNVIALYLTGYGNAIFDVNTLEGVDDSLFDVNPDTAPPLGAPVSLVFSLEEIDD